MTALLRTSTYTFAASIMFVMMLAGCVPPTHQSIHQPDPDLGKEQLQLAEDFYNTRQYLFAAEQLELAANNIPYDGHIAARQGEVLEQLEKYNDARAAYQRGLKMANDNLIEIHYQLGRLEAFHFHRPAEAEKIAAGLPTGSWQKDDLDALIISGYGDNRLALEILSRLSHKTSDKAASAFIFFDTAIVNEKLGNIPEAFSYLHKSVNHVEHKGLSRQIESYWSYLKKTYPMKDRKEP